MSQACEFEAVAAYCVTNCICWLRSGDGESVMFKGRRRVTKSGLELPFKADSGTAAAIATD